MVGVAFAAGFRIHPLEASCLPRPQWWPKDTETQMLYFPVVWPDVLPLPPKFLTMTPLLFQSQPAVFGSHVEAVCPSIHSLSLKLMKLTLLLYISYHNYLLMSTATPTPRVYRTSLFSRERNRMHARKTRQRKKEHMQKLQDRADELKLKQIRLKQSINEKNTANILVGLFQTGEDAAAVTTADGSDDSVAVVSMDQQVEVLLKRPTEEIPDASKIPELPALILPGQHTKRKSSSSADGAAEDNTPTADGAAEDNTPTAAAATDGEGATPEGDGQEEDGIDYTLLGKDRGSCTPAELDQIRRERNRMHAKRTRDRKRIFMEEMETMIKQLEDENALLQGHMDKLNENSPDEHIAAAALLAATATLTLLGKDRGSCTPAELDQIRRERNRMHAKRTRDRKRIFMEEMETMIKQLEDENALLQGHMDKLNENSPDEHIAAAALLAATATLTPPPINSVTPELGPVASPTDVLVAGSASATADPLAAAPTEEPSKGDFLNQIESLLAAAGAFVKSRSECEVNAISISCAASDVTDQSSYGEDEHSGHDRPNKKQRHLEEEDRHTSVPKSITTTNISLQ